MQSLEAGLILPLLLSIFLIFSMQGVYLLHRQQQISREEQVLVQEWNRPSGMWERRGGKGDKGGTVVCQAELLISLLDWGEDMLAAVMTGKGGKEN